MVLKFCAKINIEQMKLKQIVAYFATCVAIAGAAPAPDAEAGLSIENACIRKDWQGGGCKWAWKKDCKDRCEAQATKKGCGTCKVYANEDSAGCAPGWHTCECYCK